MTPICLDNCLYAPGHTFYELLTYIRCNFIPLMNQSIPQFMCSFGWVSVLAKLLFEMFPEVFNGIKVWRLYWLWYKLDIIVFKPFCGLPRCVFGVIVLLKVMLMSNFSKLFTAPSPKIWQYWSAFIFPSTSISIPTPFQPIHLHTMRLFPPLFPYIDLPIWSNPFYLCFIWPYIRKIAFVSRVPWDTLGCPRSH